ncbi:FUSC family protein [uncultured Enterococcus sp.]|uniref:FUSC family protein n=1 Tax=uncultured Enterococcus sp. TaxID=167972 RepID=UPI002AA8A606|nr:FUSC family protein [uncultured Enterococcus sp.]
MKDKNKMLRPLGSGLAMAVPLVIGILTNDLKISSVGTMGAFSYLAFQHRSLAYNMKAISIHGLSLLTAFILGAGTAMIPWSAPFIISILSFAAFVASKVFRIPKPDYFFVIMLYATGFNFQADSFVGILHHSTYLLYGIAGSLFSGCLISLLEKLPHKIPKERYQQLSAVDKYYLTMYEHPNTLVKALNFSMVLFIATYIAYLLRESNGYWVLISAAAVLAGEHMDRIKNRTVGRVVGGIVGIMLGFLLVTLGLPLEINAVILVILNILTEFYMPINYMVANFFTNPQVLLLMAIGTNFVPLELIPMRLSGALIGSLLAMCLIFVMEYCLQQLQPDKGASDR